MRAEISKQYAVCSMQNANIAYSFLPTVYFLNWTILLSIFLLFPICTFSQEVQVEAKMDTTKLLIGDQARITLEASFLKNIRLQWTSVPDTFNKIEVVSLSPLDTLVKDNHYQIRQTVYITSFDSGYHVIPPFIFMYKKPGDTAAYIAETGALLATVYTLPVDTTKAFRDIKEPIEVPYTFLEFLLDYYPYILAVMILGAGGVLLHYFLTRKKEEAGAEPVLRKPAHEMALEELKILESQKLWQQGKEKEYHSRLSEITRTYLERRFLFPAMEQTTDEIMERFNHPAAPELKNKLQELLRLADLVKFAKAKPVPAENELCLQYAYAVVNETCVNTTEKNIDHGA